jgi:hemin uptake protein HemP
MTPQRGNPNDSARATHSDRPVDPSADPVVLDSATLFGRRNEIRVRHNGQEYRLRITKAGKLILTK